MARIARSVPSQQLIRALPQMARRAWYYSKPAADTDRLARARTHARSSRTSATDLAARLRGTRRSVHPARRRSSCVRNCSVRSTSFHSVPHSRTGRAAVLGWCAPSAVLSQRTLCPCQHLLVLAVRAGNVIAALVGAEPFAPDHRRRLMQWRAGEDRPPVSRTSAARQRQGSADLLRFRPMAGNFHFISQHDYDTARPQPGRTICTDDGKSAARILFVLHRIATVAGARSGPCRAVLACRNIGASRSRLQASASSNVGWITKMVDGSSAMK